MRNRFQLPRRFRRLIAVVLAAATLGPALAATGPVPANATASAAGLQWTCNPGFRRSQDACLRVVVPANAHATDAAYGPGWDCARAYRLRNNDTCVAVQVPDNG